MKLIIVGLALFFTSFSCHQQKHGTEIKDSSSVNTSSNSVAVITFSTPFESDNDFIFTTYHGTMLVVADALTAQIISDELKEKKGYSLSELGVGNAFGVLFSSKKFFCTATHVAVGLEKEFLNLGADIVLIDKGVFEKRSTNLELLRPYEMDTVVYSGDSVFIKGYMFNKQGKLQSVTIRGCGRLVEKNEYDNENTQKFNFELMQDRTLSLELTENIDLAGLSGAPAFNRAGKVIGVYSGRLMQIKEGRTTYFLRVSLFH